MELAHHCQYRITLLDSGSQQSDAGQQSMDPVDDQVVSEQKETDQFSTKSPEFISLRIRAPFHFLDIAVASLAVLPTALTRPLYHIHSLLYIHSPHSFAKHSKHSLLLIGVQVVEELSEPIVQDSEDVRDTAAAKTITSSPWKQIPSHPSSESSIKQPPKLEIS